MTITETTSSHEHNPNPAPWTEVVQPVHPHSAWGACATCSDVPSVDPGSTDLRGPDKRSELLSVAAIQMSVLMGASIAVERIFALPGLGTLLIDSVVRGDFPILQGAVLVIATAVLAINLAADVGYALINPKVRAS